MESLKDQGFIFHTLEQKPDYEGRVIATLIEKKTAKASKNAFLYLHGFNDYFFQVHLADWANQQGMNFYALELRKYGRSILPHQKPNDFRDYHEYFEDIDGAIDFIKSKDKNEKIVFMGHSTGGLLAALFADEHKNEHLVDLLILNSPFFEFNIPPLLKKTFLPFMTSIGKYLHGVASPVGLDKGYGFSLHKSHFGEWDYDLSLKPDAGFKIHASWIRAIHLAHTKLQQGLDIRCPVLVMYSGKSAKPGNYRPDMQGADSVLNVKEIEAFSNGIGKKVQQKSLKPDAGFKIHACWIRAIHLAHTKLQQGLDIRCPVLVMYSGKSVKPGNYRPEMHGADSVLNVKEIEAFSNGIGKKVQQKSFDGGVHDLLLSKQEVRDRVFKAMAEFIKLNNR